MTVDLTENELKALLNAAWLQLYARTSVTPTGSYRAWLLAAHAKITAALPPPCEFAENH